MGLCKCKTASGAYVVDAMTVKRRTYDDTKALHPLCGNLERRKAPLLALQLLSSPHQDQEAREEYHSGNVLGLIISPSASNPLILKNLGVRS